MSAVDEEDEAAVVAVVWGGSAFAYLCVCVDDDEWEESVVRAYLCVSADDEEEDVVAVWVGGSTWVRVCVDADGEKEEDVLDVLAGNCVCV